MYEILSVVFDELIQEKHTKFLLFLDILFSRINKPSD